MYIPFDQMADSSRIWIYQAERKLSEEEAKFIERAAQTFLQGWQAHGQDLKSSFKIEHDQFLILTVDESLHQASGCSIDASVHLIKKIEEALNVSFSNNGFVAFLVDAEIQLKPFNKIKSSIQQKEINPDSIMFDNTIQFLGDFKSKWQVSSKDSWVSRYF